MSAPMRSPLEGKVVRPGLGGYSYYHSDRHPQHSGQPTTQASVKKVRSGSGKKWVMLIAAVSIAAFIGLRGGHNVTGNQADQTTGASNSQLQGTLTTNTQQQIGATKVDHCKGNNLAKFVSVDIGERHMWACEGTKQVKDYPVITGMQQIAENATPAGTYKIYAKATDTRLTGNASTGAWDEPVNYWMPFLDNQYGTYGFHDAPWRKISEFGHTDPNSTNGSHGCVQMSTTAMAWLYNWADTGTTITITD